MGMGELLDQSFRVFGRCWKPLFLITMLLTVPSMLLSGAFQSATVLAAFNSASIQIIRDLPGAEALIGTWLLTVLVTVALTPLVMGGLIITSAHAVQGRAVEAGQALRLAARRYWPALGTVLLMILFILLALPVLVIGGLVILAVFTVPIGYLALFVYSAFTLHSVVLEGHPGGLAPIKRSFRLVRGRFWPLLGLGIVFSLMTSVLTGGLFAVMVAIAAALPPGPLMGWLLALGTGISSSLTTPLGAVGLTLAYYDTRMRKEGLDLELQADPPPVSLP